MKSIQRAVAAAKQLESDIAAGKERWIDAIGVLMPFIDAHTLPPMVSAMSPALKQKFVDAARFKFAGFDVAIASKTRDGLDASDSTALREWLYHQPFDVDPTLPPPTMDEAVDLWTAVTFQRLLPHVKHRSVESLLDQLPKRWRNGTLRSLLRGMRPGLPIILATCRAHGQDEEPWHILMEWEAGQPTP